MTSAILQRNSIQKFLSTTCCNRLVSRSYSSQKTLTRASSSSQSAASSSKDVLSSTHGPVDFVTHEELPSHDDYPPSGSHSQRRRDTNQRNKGGRRRIKADDRPYIEPVIAPSLPLPTGKTYVTRLGPLPAPEERGTLLNHLQVSSTEPTLADLQAFRPQEMPGLGSPEYAKVYKTVREQISSSFTKAQMRSFEMLYVQGDISLSKPKMRIVEDIMEKAWGMPSPSKVERDRKEQKEVKSATLPVSAAQLFLLLGKDGSELLHLATEHGVHVSVASSPLSLTVRGVKKGLQSFKKDFREKLQRISRREIETSFSINSTLLHRISRISGAFLESSHNKIVVTGLEEKAIDSAVRLCHRASILDISRNVMPLLVQLPPTVTSDDGNPAFPSTFALYPFLLHRTTPWTMGTGGAFRLRRVGEWLSNYEPGKSNLADQSVLSDVHGNHTSLEDIFPKASLDTSVLPHPTLKVSFGHILFPASQEGAQRATLVPPLSGARSFSSVSEWLRETRSQPTFVPILPRSLRDMSPAQQTLVHRLVYRNVGVDDSRGSTFPSGWHGTNVLGVEIDVPHPEAKNIEETELEVQEDKPAHFWRGIEYSCDILQPSKTYDIRLSRFVPKTMERDATVEELETYLSQVKDYLLQKSSTRPLPPSRITYLNEEYILSANVSVRRSTEHVPVKTESDDVTSLPAIAESVYDLESSQKSTSCELELAETDLENWDENFKQWTSAISSISNDPWTEHSSHPLNDNTFSQL